MFDTQEKIGGSLVQHGPFNQRAYLMKLDPADLPELPNQLTVLCSEHGYTKCFAKIPASFRGPFDAAGYREEARVPRMYAGHDDAVFLSLYLDPARAEEKEPERVVEVLAIARDKAGGSAVSNAVPIEEAGPDDTAEMAEVYRQVFASYPFPIHEPGYLAETMASHVRYFCVRGPDGGIVALSSAEMDRNSACVEMTDFATLPAARGQGLAVHLLAHMEEAMRAQGDVEMAYTIARSRSPGMNVTFARAGYVFAGTLINNTNISGAIESMNVWYKILGV